MSVHPDFAPLQRFSHAEITSVVEAAFCAEKGDLDLPSWYIESFGKATAIDIIDDYSITDCIESLINDGGWDEDYAQRAVNRIPMVAREELAMAARMAGRA